MYESPITRFVDQQIIDIVEDHERAEEKHLCFKIEESIGYKINPDELIKALQYDRDQYERGYADASGQPRPEAQWIEHISKLGDTWFECPLCHEWWRKQTHYCGNCGVKLYPLRNIWN